MPGAQTSLLMDVSPKEIYDVVTDFESYPDFLSDVKKVTVEKKGKTQIVNFEISVIKKISYTLAFTMTPGKKVSWTFVKGDFFKDNTGSWEFKEVKKGQTVIILESMKMQNELKAPRDGIVQRISVAAGTSVEQGKLLVTMT